MWFACGAMLNQGAKPKSRHLERIASGLLAIGGIVSICAPATCAQVMTRPPAGATVLVHVEEASGAPLSGQAYVTLSSTGESGLTAETRNAGTATFRGVAAGDYEVEVTATGYETSRDRVLVMGGSSAASVYVVMKPRGNSAATGSASQPPLLTGKSRREFDRALAALNAGKLEDAGRHLEYPLKHAANDPNVQYLAGVYAFDLKDWSLAKQHFESAISYYHDHASAQLDFGSLLLQQLNDPAEAIPHLTRALELDPQSWRGHWLIAQAYLIANGDYARAQFHASRAIELGKEKSAAANLTLAYAAALGGNRPEAREILQKFVTDYPNDPAVPRAHQMLQSPFLAEINLSTGAAQPPFEVAKIAPAKASTATALPLQPKNVDAEVPPVTEGTPCSLPDVLAGAAQRESEFVVALERFSAKESISQDELDNSGLTRKSFSNSFDYVAILEHPRPDRIVVRETRRGYDAAASPSGMALGEGLPAIGLILSSQYSGDFNFTCEGLSRWRGQPAWQLHFEQRADREPRIHSWVVNGEPYPMLLKGRAWIAAGSFRLLRIETDLVQPVPKIKLDFEHMAIDYAPVDFTTRKEQLWLPVSAEVYSRIRGRIFREDHQFANFLLFSVDTGEKISPSSQN